MRKRLAVLALFFVAGALNSGCAILHEDNRRLLNMLDVAMADTVATRTTVGKVLFAPFYIPVGLAAGVADAVLVNPAVAAPAAGRETHDLVWKKQPESRVEHVLLFVPKVVASPIVFSGYWLFFILVPVQY